MSNLHDGEPVQQLRKRRETERPEIWWGAPEGGFVPETEIMTTAGPVNAAELTAGDRVYALSPTGGLVKPRILTGTDRVLHEGTVVEIGGKRVDLRLHPDHPVLYRTKSIRYPQVVRAAHLTQREYYRFINDWVTPDRPRLETVDITELVDEFEARAVTSDHGHTFRAALPEGCEPSYVNSHSGYHFDPEMFKRYQSVIESVADEVSVREGRKQRTVPYLFAGDDFIEFIGWYVTEGSVYWPAGKRTAQVQIAQDNPTHRRRIRALLDRMSLNVSINERRFTFGSSLFGQLLERLCGSGSESKRLPSFVWRLSTDQQALLLRTLLRGDGNVRGTYYTSSQQLAWDVLRLGVEVGVKPRYTRRNGMWQIYLREGNDGFRASKNVSTIERSTTLYQFTVEDYCAVLAGCDGRFQWVGVNSVV
jgi:DNA polymerase I